VWTTEEHRGADVRAWRDRLASMQGAALEVVGGLLASASPYWQARFGAAGWGPGRLKGPDDLFDAPTMTKADYMAALAASPHDYGGLLCGDLREINRAGAIIYRTTGTTGRQGRFINTHDGFGVFGRQGSVLLREAGGEPGGTVMIMFPLSFWAAGWGFYYASRELRCTLVPAGAPIDTATRLQLLDEYRPDVVVLTPSYALTLGAAAEAAGLDLASLGVKGLLLGGESFPPSRRARIEATWGVPGRTRNFYGISEGGPLFAVECSEQDGLHLFEEDVVHQFWVPEGNEPIAEGELGEHVFTALHQRTMATWFNFRTRDAAIYTDEPCRCGRSTRRMWVMERLDDMVKVKGVNIFASGVEEILSPIPEVGDEFRLVIDREADRDRLTLQVEVDAGADVDAVRHLVGQRLRVAIGTLIDIETLGPGTLPKTELKARRWLDRRPKE